MNFVPAAAAKINIYVPFFKLTARGWDPSNQMACSIALVEITPLLIKCYFMNIKVQEMREKSDGKV